MTQSLDGLSLRLPPSKNSIAQSVLLFPLVVSVSEAPSDILRSMSYASGPGSFYKPSKKKVFFHMTTSELLLANLDDFSLMGAFF